MASRATDAAVPLAPVRAGLTSPDPTVRYWAAVGMVVRGQDAVAATAPELERMLTDESPGARIAAAEALGRYGSAAARARAIDTLVALSDASAHEEYVALLALNSLVHVPSLPAEVRAAVAALPKGSARSNQRGNGIHQMIEQIAEGVH